MDAVVNQSHDLDALTKRLLTEVAAAQDLAALDAIRVSALGKKGEISELMKQLGSMPHEERRSFGAAVNVVKDRVAAGLETRKAELGAAALAAKLATDRVDITLPVRPNPAAEGRIHPISRVWEELMVIFADMGFAVAEGPDIETDDNNFTRLNFPPGHPAREAHDTFFFSPNAEGERLLLRTHTSPVQVRTMLAQKPPIRIIAPGRVYRMDSDQTHTPMFHQVEGLVIDRDTHMGHLKWVLEEFCKAFFEVNDVKMRFRMSHFPFTEPSAEVDIQCDRLGAELKIGEGERLAGNPRLRHGASQGARGLRNRSRGVAGLRLRHGHRPHRHAEIWNAGFARLFWRRPALAETLRVQPACDSFAGRRVIGMTNSPNRP